MTTNFERIKQMNIDELAEILTKPKCTMCYFNDMPACGRECHSGLKFWLEKESEE